MHGQWWKDDMQVWTYSSDPHIPASSHPFTDWFTWPANKQGKNFSHGTKTILSGMSFGMVIKILDVCQKEKWKRKPSKRNILLQTSPYASYVIRSYAAYVICANYPAPKLKTILNRESKTLERCHHSVMLSLWLAQLSAGYPWTDWPHKNVYRREPGWNGKSLEVLDLSERLSVVFLGSVGQSSGTGCSVPQLASPPWLSSSKVYYPCTLSRLLDQLDHRALPKGLKIYSKVLVFYWLSVHATSCLPDLICCHRIIRSSHLCMQVWPQLSTMQELLPCLPLGENCFLKLCPPYRIDSVVPRFFRDCGGKHNLSTLKLCGATIASVPQDNG